MEYRRLDKIASFVRKGAILVDIGCDHGLLGIGLLKKNLVKYVYASDVNHGPLANVESNIQYNNVSQQMSALLSDGLEKFTNIDFDDLVIAGMGGSLIVSIIENQNELLSNKRLILQPNNNSYGLRSFLLDNNYKILEEALIKDQNIIYEIIVVEGFEAQQYNQLELCYGRYNLYNNNELTLQLINNDLIKKKSIIEQMPQQNARYNTFEDEIVMLEEYLYGTKRVTK